MFQKFIKSFLVILVILIGINSSIVYAVDWVTISGEVTTKDGTPLCAMVLANGQHMFSCDPIGQYSLYVPLDNNEQITLYVFSDGRLPFKRILNRWENTIDISMSTCADEGNGNDFSIMAGLWTGTKIQFNVSENGEITTVGSAIKVPNAYGELTPVALQLGPIAVKIGTCTYQSTSYFYDTIPITNNYFSVEREGTSGKTTITGDFYSATESAGEYTIFDYECSSNTNSSDSWSASAQTGVAPALSTKLNSNFSSNSTNYEYDYENGNLLKVIVLYSVV